MGAMVEIDCSRVTLKVMEPGVVFQLPYILCYNVLCDFVPFKNQCLANSLLRFSYSGSRCVKPRNVRILFIRSPNTIIMCPF